MVVVMLMVVVAVLVVGLVEQRTEARAIVLELKAVLATTTSACASPFRTPS